MGFLCASRAGLLRHFIAISSSFGRHNSVGLFVVILIISISIGQRFQAADFQIHQQRQALSIQALFIISDKKKAAYQAAIIKYIHV